MGGIVGIEHCTALSLTVLDRSTEGRLDETVFKDELNQTRKNCFSAEMIS